MNKKFGSLILAGIMAVNLTISAVGAGNGFVGSPEGGQDVKIDSKSEIEVVTDNIVTGGYILQKGVSEKRPLNEIDYPVIKITTMAMSISANQKVDAANPGISAKQKAGMMTESGLNYADNATVNEVADCYYSSDTTRQFADSYSLSVFDRVVAATKGNLENYKVIQIANISANIQAIEVGENVSLTFSAPGVKTDSRIAVARIKNNSLEFITSSAGNGTISFEVHPNNLGTFVLMTYVEQESV